MPRKEFGKPVKREALRRSGLLCEAVGAMYGLPFGTRCNAKLSAGVEYDHIVLDANSKDNSIDNCAAVCIKCHRWKSAKHDIPMAAKTVRMQDKATGIKRPKHSIESPGFPKMEKPERSTKAALPPRRLYQEAGE